MISFVYKLAEQLLNLANHTPSFKHPLLYWCIQREVYCSLSGGSVLSINQQAYRTKHQAEYQLHDSLKKELQDLGVTKIPSSNKIQKQIENLESEQAATLREKQELQKKQKTLEIIQQNFTALLDAPEISSDLLLAKREPVSVTKDK